MVTVARPDLDGACIHVPVRNEVWLVFHGSRHYVANSSVFDSLFEGIAGLRKFDTVDDILVGPALNDGTCLVRADGDASVYMITGQPGSGVRRHKIDGPQSWTDFGFSLNVVKAISHLVLSGLPFGRELQSAGHRRAAVKRGDD